MLAWGGCGRNGVGMAAGARLKRNSKSGKTLKYYFQCRRADIFGDVAFLEAQAVKT